MAVERAQWTATQREAIAATGCGLLVSAAAGSGKTAVLAARCANLVCGSNPRCDVDELLVVTFTEAAAAEMKNRIQRALRQRLAKSNESDYLARQIALLEHAHISTLHSFCAKIVRQHFHMLEWDPAFSILDGDEAALLRLEIARELLTDRYEHEESKLFRSLVDHYTDGNDDRLAERLVKAHEMLCSVVDPESWRTEALRRVIEAADVPLVSSSLGRELIAMVRQRLTALQQNCHTAATVISRMKGFDAYVRQLDELEKVLELWDAAAESDGLDALAEVIADFQIPKLSTVPSATPGKDLAKATIDSVREQMKEGPLRQCLQFSESTWRQGLSAIAPYTELYLELVGEFGERYAAAKRAARAVDFADLERGTLHVLRDHAVTDNLAPSAVARAYHAQFKHVLVDEYQDINEVQDAILTLVSRECLGGKDEGGRMKDERSGSSSCSNLFCVGDVKQSIYRFRLAEPRRFLERYHRFRQSPQTGLGKVIDLQANFRSRAPLLEAINAVFERLMTAEAAEISYDESHALRPGLTYPPPEACGFHGAPLELHLLPKSVDLGGEEIAGESSDSAALEELELDRAKREATLAARRIRQLMGLDGARRMSVTDRGADGALYARPIRFGDVVILLRALQFKADCFAQTLQDHGIPVHSAGGGGFFESVEVRDMLSLLSVLDNQRQDIPLAALLRSPLAALPEQEDALARIRLACRDEKRSTPFHEAVVSYANEQDDELAAHLRQLLAQLAEWRTLAHQRPLAEVIWRIYDESGYLAFCAGLADGAQRSANLVALHERARQFGTFQRQGLSRFIAFLESLEREIDLGQPSVASEAQDVVRIMSVHGAKGLEFPVVLLPDLGKAINLQDCHGPILMDRSAYLGLSVVDEARRIRYPSLAWTMAQERIRRQTLAEELRVLYVAMTRAKEHLILIGTAGETQAQRWTSLWSSHAGALPADAVLAARSYLDWLGPVAAATSARASPPIQIIPHDATEIATWAASATPRLSEHQSHLAQLRPLVPPPPPNETAEKIIHRLSATYPHRHLCSLPAGKSVTELAKHGDGATKRSVNVAADLDRMLPRPRCVLSGPVISAADRGTVTHQVLEHLRFDRPATHDEVRRQINELVARRMLLSHQAAAVDVEGIVWLLETEVGQLLRAHARSVLRELAVYHAAGPDEFGMASSSDPLDRVMIRGRIDVLIPTPRGLVIADYKTDRVEGDALADRIEVYTRQMVRYQRAIADALVQPPPVAHLLFLTPRKVHSIPAP